MPEIAELGDDRAGRVDRGLLIGFVLHLRRRVLSDHHVDGAGLEPGDGHIDLELCAAEGFQLLSQNGKIPFCLFGNAIVSDAVGALLAFAQAGDTDDR